jgi:electron transport complex protein RnfE
MSKSKDSKLYGDFLRGILNDNPVFRQLLGMCPTLAVTTSGINGLSMGLAVVFVLTSSSIIVSTFRKLIPEQVRIATFTVIIATFVTIADLFMAAKFPTISRALGPYVPLIVVNCIILGRQEAFARRHSVNRSFMDALGMGLGFTLALVVLGSVRELFGSGSIFNVPIAGSWFKPWLIMILPPGAFITLGLLIATMNALNKEKITAPKCHRL